MFFETCWRQFDRLFRCESVYLSRQFFDLVEVVQVVGREDEDAVVAKCSKNRLEKLSIDETSSLMAPLRPRIGKEKIEDCDRIWRKQVRNSIRTFDAKNAHICDALMHDLTARSPRSAEQALKTEKIPLGSLFRQRDEERTITTSEIDLDRHATRKHRI